MAIKAVARHYFDPSACPVTAVEVAPGASGDTDEHVGGGFSGAHPHDLTGIEHDHDFDELVIVTAGRATHHLPGYTVPVAAGDVYLLQSGDRHYFSDRQGLGLLNVMYDPALLDLPADELRQIPGFNALFLFEPVYRRRHRFQSRLYLSPSQMTDTLRLAHAIRDEVAQRGPGYAVAAKTKLLELMIYLARQYDQTPTTEGRSLLRLGTLIGAMEQSFDEPWTLAQMAKKVHMSPSNLVRVFRKATGLTPMRYLIRLRARHAGRLLVETDLTITQIAQRCGFDDPNYFSRQFRQCLGVTPSQHRKASA